MEDDYVQMEEGNSFSSPPSQLWVDNCIQLLAHILRWRWGGPLKDHMLVAVGNELGKRLGNLKLYSEKEEHSEIQQSRGRLTSECLPSSSKKSILLMIEFYFFLKFILNKWWGLYLFHCSGVLPFSRAPLPHVHQDSHFGVFWMRSWEG